MREVLAVSELPASPVAAVVGAQELDLLEQLEGLVPVADGGERDRQLTGFGRGHPRLVTDAAHAKTRYHEGVPARLEQSLGGHAAYRASEDRVIPVHREPALVSEGLTVAGNGVPEQRRGKLPARLRLRKPFGQRDRAAKAVVHARAAGEQRVAVRRAVFVAAPDNLAARRLQADGELDGGADHWPHPRGEILIAGHQQFMPDADCAVGRVVALGSPLAVRSAGGLHRPGPVRLLRIGEPGIGAACFAAQSAHAQRHRALHMVPCVDMPVRPADRAVGLLVGRDRPRRRMQLARGKDSRNRRRTASGRCGAGRRGAGLRLLHAPSPPPDPAAVRP